MKKHYWNNWNQSFQLLSPQKNLWLESFDFNCFKKVAIMKLKLKMIFLSQESSRIKENEPFYSEDVDKVEISLIIFGSRFLSFLLSLHTLHSIFVDFLCQSECMNDWFETLFLSRRMKCKLDIFLVLNKYSFAIVMIVMVREMVLVAVHDESSCGWSTVIYNIFIWKNKSLQAKFFIILKNFSFPHF